MRLYKILVLLLLSCSTYAQWGPAQNSYQRIKGVWPFERLKLPSDTSATKEANTIVAVGNKLWLSNGTYYIDVTGAGGLGGVTSFNTRTGAVSLIANDVNVALGYIPVSPSDTASMLFAYARLTRFIDSCTALRSAINAVGTPPVSSVFGRTGAITAQAGDYSIYYPSISRFLDSTAAVWARVQTGYQPAGSYLVAGNNLADVTNIATARTNLSVLSQSEVLQRITDSLRSLVRLRASGSGGIDIQNSSGTSVATFGTAGTTNGSIAGGWNVGGNLAVTGTGGFTGKATFSDSIVGNIIRSRNTSGVSIQNNSGTTIASFGSSGGSTTNLAELSVTSGVSAQTGTFSNVLTVSGASNYLSLNNIGYVRADATGNTLDLQVGTGGLRIMNNGYGSSLFNITNTGAATFSGALTATAQGNNITQSVDSAITGTSYTLVLGDAGYFKRVTNSSAVTITIPENSSVAFPVGTYIILQQQGTGQITIAPASSNVSFESPDGALKSRTRYSKITLLKVNTNRWDIGGDLTN